MTSQPQKSVLLIDDSPDFSFLCSLALRTLNLETTRFTSSFEAFQYLIESTTLPALVLVDLNMPKMSGEDFLKDLRANSRFNQIKVLFISGSQNLSAIASFHGADGFLRKPFNLTDISRLVQKELASPRHLKDPLNPSSDIHLQ